MTYRRVFVAAMLSMFVAAAMADTVTGRLIDSAGKPLAGVKLGAYVLVPDAKGQISFMPLTVVSASDGAFRLDKAAYAPTPERTIELMAKLSNGHVAVVSLSANGGDAVATDHSNPFRIRVTDLKGKAIEGAKVIVETLSTKRHQQEGLPRYTGLLREELNLSTKTDKQGLATFDGMPADSQGGISVTYPGRVKTQKFISFPNNQSSAEVVVLPMAATLAGRVLQGGKPVAGATVIGSNSTHRAFENWQAITDKDGNYRIETPPGRVDLRVQAAGPTSDWVVKSITEVAAVEGHELDGLNFVMSKGILIRGSVRTQTGGKPVANAELAAICRPLDSYSIKTDARGQFEVRALPGEVEVAVQKVGGHQYNGSISTMVNVDETHNPPFDIRIPDSDILPPISHLSGTVVDGAGMPVAGASVHELTSREVVLTDSAGHFRLEQDALSGDALFAEKADAIGKEAVRVSTSPAVALRLDSTAAVIQGRITDDNGKPLAKAEITVGGQIDKAYLAVEPTKTDEEGRYRFTGLFGGADSFFLWAKKAGFGDETIQPIKLQPGETKDLPALKLELADGTIDGHVLEADGKPAKGASVTAQIQSVPPVFTDDNGTFHLTQIPRGKHFLMAGRNGSFSTGANASTGQKDVVIKLSPMRTSTPGVVFQDMTGRQAPALKMSTWIGGKAYNLADYKGKYVVLDFWAIWCHPCVEALPQVKALAEKYGKQGVTFIGIHVAGTPLPKIKAWLKQHPLTYPIGVDIENNGSIGLTSEQYSPRGIPSVYIVGPDGKIVLQSNEIEEAQKALEKLLAKGK